MIVDGLAELDEFPTLGGVHVAHKCVGWWCSEESDEIFNSGPQQVCTVEVGECSFGEPSQLVHDPCVTSSLGAYSVTAVVLERWANVPSLDRMWCPCVLCCGFDMCHYFYAWWRNRVGIEVKTSVDAFPHGELWGNVCASQEIQGEFSMWQCFVPQVHREVVIG